MLLLLAALLSATAATPNVSPEEVDISTVFGIKWNHWKRLPVVTYFGTKHGHPVGTPEYTLTVVGEYRDGAFHFAVPDNYNAAFSEVMLLAKEKQLVGLVMADPHTPKIVLVVVTESSVRRYGTLCNVLVDWEPPCLDGECRQPEATEDSL